MYHKAFTSAVIVSGLALVCAQDLAALPACAVSISLQLLNLVLF